MSEPEGVNETNPLEAAWKFMRECDAAGRGYYNSYGRLEAPIIEARLWIYGIFEGLESKDFMEAVGESAESDLVFYSLGDTKFRLANDVIFHRLTLDEAKEAYLDEMERVLMDLPEQKEDDEETEES